MGSPIKYSNAERVETTALNTKVNKEVFNAFKDCCKEQGYQLNIVLETFMRQYSSGRFNLSKEDIMKWKNDDSEMDTLSTTFSKKIYTDFKFACKSNGYFVKHIVTAFMEQYSNRELILEYVNVAETKE